MIKTLSIFLAVTLFLSSVAFAEVKKVAVVDVQKVVAKSAQVQALKRDQELKQKDLAYIVKKASEEIEKQTDPAKKQAVVQKYEKQLKAKRESNAKAYQAKLEAIDKSINNTITQHAKSLGYDLVLTKGVVLYGGDDITDAILKIVK